MSRGGNISLSDIAMSNLRRFVGEITLNYHLFGWVDLAGPILPAGDSLEPPPNTSVTSPLHLRRRYGGTTEVQRRYSGVAEAAGGRLWLILDVLSGYGDKRCLRIGGSRGGIRSLAENNGQARGLICGVGTRALVCLGRSFQPLIAAEGGSRQSGRPAARRASQQRDDAAAVANPGKGRSDSRKYS